jgi:hypothetical protein
MAPAAPVPPSSSRIAAAAMLLAGLLLLASAVSGADAATRRFLVDVSKAKGGVDNPNMFHEQASAAGGAAGRLLLQGRNQNTRAVAAGRVGVRKRITKFVVVMDVTQVSADADRFDSRERP